MIFLLGFFSWEWYQGVHLEIPIHPAMNMVFYALLLGILVVSRTEKRNDRNHVRVTYNIHRWILNTGNFFVRRLYKDAKIRHIPQILILILKKIQASCKVAPRMGIPARTARSESIRMPGHTKRKEVFLWSKRWWWWFVQLGRCLEEVWNPKLSPFLFRRSEFWNCGPGCIPPLGRFFRVRVGLRFSLIVFFQTSVFLLLLLWNNMKQFPFLMFRHHTCRLLTPLVCDRPVAL